MLTMIAIVVIPALWMVMTCFKEPAELASVKQSFFPKQFRFEKFAETWSRMKLHKYFINTLIMSIGAVVADVIVNGLAGYVLSKLKLSLEICSEIFKHSFLSDANIMKSKSFFISNVFVIFSF